MSDDKEAAFREAVCNAKPGSMVALPDNRIEHWQRILMEEATHYPKVIVRPTSGRELHLSTVGLPVGSRVTKITLNCETIWEQPDEAP